MSISSQKLNRVSQNAAIVYRRLCNPAIGAHSLNEKEVRSLKTYCFALISKWSVSVAHDVRRGRFRDARRLQVRLFESPAARLVAAWQADAKIRKRRRRQLRARGAVSVLRPQRFADVWQLAEQLSNARAPASAIILEKPKRSGGYRLLCVPDRFGVAKQHLLVNAIKPFASFHPSQFALRRGRSVACESLLRTMNEPDPCNTRFVQFDVVDFYTSISRQYVEEVLPAPKAVIRNTLFLEGWNISGVTMDRRGLPQGLAASSLVAEMVMANVLRDIADLTADLHCIHAYSDNWGGFVPHDKDVGVLVESLKHAFEVHRAGPYRITHDYGERGQSFKFLGYYFKPRADGPARVSLPKNLVRTMESELTGELCAADSIQEVLKVRSRLLSFCSAYSLAAETRPLLSRVGRLIVGELDYRYRQFGEPRTDGTSLEQVTRT